MAEYIERETMIENIVQEALYYCYHEMNGESRGLMSAKELLQKAPAADVEPVRRGHWIKESEHILLVDGTYKEWNNFYCSECDSPENAPRKFCAECGAKMEEYKSDIT